MNSKIKDCQYPVLQKYFSENDFSEAIDHITGCHHCLNRIINVDRNLILLNSLKYANETAYDENELSGKIDELLNIEKRTEKSISDIAIPEAVIKNLHNYINDYSSDKNVKTPGFLKNIVTNEMNKIEKKSLQNIVIRISDGLKMIGNYIDNIIIIPEELVPVIVRSGNEKTEKAAPGSINFVQILDEGEVNFNVIKDGPESVMLTINFESMKIKPDYVNMRYLNQAVLSQQLKNDFAYFSKLKEGNYCIELKYRYKMEMLSIPFSIV